MANDEKNLINDINTLLKTFEAKITKPNKVKEIWIKRLILGKKVINWSITKYNMFFGGSPNVVKKRYIFYCELGFNLTSEQEGKRPVVVLQNDRGNSSSPTTIVAPISTHQGMKIVETKNNKTIIEFTDDFGKVRTKTLDYYEIPVEIESGYKKNITGCVNLAQIRTVSKKRLDKSHVAIMTDDSYKKIKDSFVKLLDL